jgi:hypothetical protein
MTFEDSGCLSVASLQEVSQLLFDSFPLLSENALLISLEIFPNRTLLSSLLHPSLGARRVHY